MQCLRQKMIKKYDAEDGRCQLQKYLDENYLDLIRNIYLMWDRGTLLVTEGTSPRDYYGKRKKKGQDPFKDINNNIISEHLYLRGWIRHRVSYEEKVC